MICDAQYITLFEILINTVLWRFFSDLWRNSIVMVNRFFVVAKLVQNKKNSRAAPKPKNYHTCRNTGSWSRFWDSKCETFRSWPRWMNLEKFGNLWSGFDCLTSQQIHFYMKFGYIYIEIEELSTSREGSRIERERYCEELRRMMVKTQGLFVHQQLQSCRG